MSSRSAASYVWWGLGATVESQLFVGGTTATLARMQSLDGSLPSCVIRVTNYQVGPGLGGGGDVVLFLASGIVNPGSFPTLTLESGWNLQLRAVGSFTNVIKDGIEVAKSGKNLIRLIKAIPLKDIVKFSIKHPAYTWSLKPAIEQLAASKGLIEDGVDIAKRKAKMWTLPTFGTGVELSAAYSFHNRVSVIDL
ncbi:MAG TPA: hypothetical protein VGO11_15085 [Chthoniobacteraceae bacterium]|jgi:hypothetical protein|nr:hypothetical protein [Chthoniobacteraceae bacterium]